MSDVNTEQMEVSKQKSIKRRLQKSFLLISLSIIFLMSAFSLVYFYKAILTESTSTIRNKLSLAVYFMENKLQETEEYSKNLASDRSIQLGLELESGVKISEYLEKLEKGKSNYEVRVFNTKGIAMTENRDFSVSEAVFLQSALNGKATSSATIISNKGRKTPTYVSFIPVMYNDDLIGVVMTRFIFENNPTFFVELSRNLECNLAIYSESNTIFETTRLPILEDTYKNVAYSDKTSENISLTTSGLNEYKSITDNAGNPVCVFRLHLSSYQYRKVFLTAFVLYLLIASIVTVIVIYLILKISASILNPIDYLLQSVNTVRAGNLAHEVILQVQDEIGRLGFAFNELRSQLNDKIAMIQNMNQSLEKTVEERTETINTLNNMMKHYLSPQLYASIVGGKRDTSVYHHYRKRLTIFFSDVANFTKTTESLEPEDLSELLNSYLDCMANIAQKYSGTIDKYVGDAIMVFFGDPEFTSDKDHAIRAVKMAMEMQESMIEFREKWRKKGIDNPFHVRVGINTGFCTIGNFGSETKMDYTIIGNNVNMAARFEAAAEPDTILISPETYILVCDEIECMVAGEFLLKGISGTIKGYRPIKVKDTQNQVEFAKITGFGEIIFPDKPIDLRLLSAKDKHQLLLSIKDTFDEVKQNTISTKEPQPSVVKKLDGEENKAVQV